MIGWDWTLIWLAASFGCFLNAGMKASWKIGKLDLHPGWIGFSIWGGLALAAHLVANY